MVFYINEINGKALPTDDVVEFLVAEGAKHIETPKRFRENLVCVVMNGSIDEVFYVFNRTEMIRHQNPRDFRFKNWLIVPDAPTLSGYDNEDNHSR
jgi:hypothetical protein